MPLARIAYLRRSARHHQICVQHELKPLRANESAHEQRGHRRIVCQVATEAFSAVSVLADLSLRRYIGGDQEQ